MLILCTSVGITNNFKGTPCFFPHQPCFLLSKQLIESNTVELMNLPSKLQTLFKEQSVMACAGNVRLGGENGILCAGGFLNDGGRTKKVQFLPLLPSPGPCRLLARNLGSPTSVMMALSTGTDVLLCMHILHVFWKMFWSNHQIPGSFWSDFETACKGYNYNRLTDS